MPPSSGADDPFRMPAEETRRWWPLLLGLLVAASGFLGAIVLYQRDRPSDEGPLVPVPPGAFVTVVPTPEDATVLVDGLAVAPRVAHTLAPGSHTLTITRDGFERVDRVVEA